MIKYNFDTHIYMHGLCQYFAIAFAELFNCKVCLWLDYDEINDREILCHAFAELQPGIFVDAKGVFYDLAERECDFEFNYKKVVDGTIDEMKAVLKRIKVPFTNTEAKKNAREFLRNNMLTFDLNGQLCGLYYSKYKESVSVVWYDRQNNKYFQYVVSRNYQVFISDNRGCIGFIENLRWYYKV